MPTSCGTAWKVIEVQSDYEIQPNHIIVNGDSVTFNFKASIPPSNFNPKLDSIVYIFTIGNRSNSTLELARSTLKLGKLTPRNIIIQHQDSISAKLTLGLDSMVLVLKPTIYNRGNSLDLQPIDLGSTVKNER